MRRFLFLICLAALIVSACSPIITPLGEEATNAAGKNAPLPKPSAYTPVPGVTPTLQPVFDITSVKGVEVILWHGWDGTTGSLLEQLAAEFNISNKYGLKIAVVSKGNLNQLTVDVEKSLAQAGQPDLVIALPEHILGWQSQLLELTPFITQKENGLDLSEIPAGFLAQSDKNGERYGLPLSRSARFIFYNASFASDLGFDGAPKTLDEFKTQACAANAFWKQDADLTNDGYGGLVLDLPSDETWQTPYSWLAANKGEIFSDGDYHFNTPQNLDSLGFLSKLREEDCAWLPDSDTNFEHLVSRRALFLTGSLADIEQQNALFKTAAISDSWTLLPFPGSQPGNVFYGPDMAILKSSPERELGAWIFLSWLLKPQNQLRLSRSTGFIPVTQTVLKMISTDITLPAQWSAGIDLIPQALVYPQTSSWRLANKILEDGMAAYDRSYPNVSLDIVLQKMDDTLSDMRSK